MVNIRAQLSVGKVVIDRRTYRDVSKFVTISEITFGDQIGVGAFGVVTKGIFKNETVAISKSLC